jgi:subtilisin-like proprotein convertase family protein
MELSELNGCIRDLKVTIDIDHTWTNDLHISLMAPSGDSVLLVEREGGSGNNFRNTTFDDAAQRSIVGQHAPFSGVFRPEESLAAFDHQNANGQWKLIVKDQASQDGGRLVSWSLDIDDGCLERVNSTPVVIDSGGPNTITSEINITEVGGSVVESVTVSLDIDHTWDQDLSITLKSPQGTEVLLIGREGGSANDFTDTVLDDNAPISIEEAEAPFTGRFRPEQALGILQNELALGTWTLMVADQASQDGGVLNSWALDIETKCAEPRSETDFQIEVRFTGGLSASQRAVFELAAARWREIIVGDLPTVSVLGEDIDDLLILAEGKHIDGPGSILGQAGPTHIRTDSKLPVRGIMSFDAQDLERMEQDGSLISVIIHEMGHVIGIGTMWEEMKLLQGRGSDDPVFTGVAAIAEYAVLRDTDQLEDVPVANTGGPGTREGHWREGTFGNELMTGFLNSGDNPLSRLTIACLQDMGYQINMDASEAFDLPTFLLVSVMQPAAHHRCHTSCPKPVAV